MILLFAILSGVLCITVFLTIRAEFANNRKQIYMFKPVSTLIIITIAILAFFFDEGNDWEYTLGIVIGLILCFGGDVALMFQSQKAFLLGLISFLLGHVAYSVILVVKSGFVSYDIYTGIAMFTLAVGLFAFLYSGLGRMKIPVIFYMLIISFMLNRGASTFFGDTFSTTQQIMIATGAFLFYVSDVILGIARFKVAFKYNRISLAFYFSGQLLIAFSVWNSFSDYLMT